MFFASLQRLLNVKIKNSSNKTLNVYRTISCRFFSKKDDCGSRPILMNPDCKTAVITGGSDGIGFATAHQLLCEKAKKVALIGIDVKKGAEAINSLNCTFGKSRAVFFKCDVKNIDEVNETLNKIKCDFEEIDIIINAAGIWDDTHWQEEMHTNLAGTININLAARDYIEKGDGVIINFSALKGLETFPLSPTFTSFATGIISFTRSFGHDENFKRFGIRVVVLCMGITQTLLLQGLEKRMLTKDMGKGMGEFLKKACCQKPDACAKAVLEIIRFGPTGSVWVVEGSRLFYYDPPDYKKHLNLVSQFV